MSEVTLLFKKSLYIHRVGGGGVRRQENDAAVLRSIQVGGVVPSRMSTQVLHSRSLGAGAASRERVLHWQPTGPNPLDHQDDVVDRPRAMGV